MAESLPRVRSVRLGTGRTFSAFTHSMAGLIMEKAQQEMSRRIARTVTTSRSSGDPMRYTFSDLTGYAAQAIEQVWEAEWRRADFFYYLTQALTRKEIKGIMSELGRSHQDAYRWAATAMAFPPGKRREDRSPRWHAAEAKAGRMVDSQ